MINLPVEFKVKMPSMGDADHMDGMNDSDEDTFVTIEGYANTSTVDRVGDIILEEAWTKGGLTNYLKNPVILAYHNHDKPIGSMVDYAVNDKGLKITAQVYKAAGEIYSLIKSGVLRTFSVGFRTKDANYDSETELFVIKDVELLEVSVVSIPANADSIFSVKKSFSDDSDYVSFKSTFGEENATTTKATPLEHKEENHMSDKDKAQLEQDLRAQIKKEIQDEAEKKIALDAAIGTQVKASVAGTVEVIGERVDVLRTEIEAKLADDSKSMQETVDALRTEIKDYAEELKNRGNSKMSFEERNSPEGFSATSKQMDEAVLLAKILAREVKDTRLGQAIIEKSAQQHLNATTSQDWEDSFTTNVENDIREKLIIEPMFRTIALAQPTMSIPLNPEAGYGTWITNAQLNAATSTGTARLHKPVDTNITAYKLATKELLGYEEEDDSLIALLPLIRDAAVRRMAKSSDKALLVGDVGVAGAAGEGNFPFNGLATIGIDDGRTAVIGGTLAAPTAVTVALLTSLRRKMGVYGHTPSDLVYVVNQEVYFDLLEDANFKTVDLVGAAATLITGQIGSISGTPVVVSGEFGAAALSSAAAICVNMSNYLIGTYRGLRVERERSVENQTNLLVMTRRFGMLEMFTANATVATLINPAL